MPRQTITGTLTSEATYALGDPVVLTLEIENTSSKAWHLLTWGTPFEDRLTGDCLIVERDGRPVPYDGRIVKRGDPASTSYIEIAPGEKAHTTIDITTAYAIDSPGTYTATLNVTFNDAFSGPSGAAPRARAAHQPLTLPPSSTTFTVTAGAEPRETDGQLARKVSAERGALAKSAARTPNFVGGTDTERADTLIAHGNAQQFAALAASQLSTTTASTNALYQTWFGAFDQGRYDNVNKHYNDISNTLLTDQVTYDLTRDDCHSDWFAFTHKGDRTVWLCNLYFSAPQIGTDCKFGTLVHEWSHAVSSTDDNVYGETGCQSLATTDPGKATNNADSHEYFAEHNAQSDFGKSLTFVTDRSTFGRDEIDAMLAAASPAVISAAFFVHADGFWPDKLGITAASLGSSPNVKPTITVSPAVPGMTVSVTALQAEDTALPIAPQRFTWVLQVSFANDSGFPSAAGGVSVITLTATLPGQSAGAQIRLVREPNPYELDGATSWLSTDVRVFQIRAGENRFGATIGSTPAAASAFIKQVLANLNGGITSEPFEGISTDQQTSALELSEKVNGTNVYNFAIAKVRYRGTTDIPNVRVFFRLFPAATTSTNFDGTTTYRRGTSGSSTVPLLGLAGDGSLLTVPCFADPRVDSATQAVTSQIDPANVATIVHAPGGAEKATYFGCWLDINQTQAQFPAKPSPANGPWSSGRKSIQELLRNAHQCLVAEIAFDPDPIPAGVSPGASDKLAQRNLAIVESANPGLEDSRRIMTTFDLHPARAVDDAVKPVPDELQIEWGNTPAGSVATIFIPEVDASHIVALAGSRYANHTLTQVDGQTIEMPASGITYVPLPPGAAFGLTGLLSLELPDTVRKGEVYTVVVRQIADAPPARVVPPPPVIGKTRRTVATAVSNPQILRWRRIVGSYQLTIPVRTKATILVREERLLSVLRWILAGLGTDDRWYPVFSRYVALIGDRVGALGGNPDQIKPSPDGSGVPAPGRPPGDGSESEPGHDRRHRHDGKVSGLIYDCFGDFEGFLLDDCGSELSFRAREHRIESLADTAWRERIAISVFATGTDPHRPTSIVFRRVSSC
jgi:hypothetical protein